MQIHPTQITSLQCRSLRTSNSVKHFSQPSFGEATTEPKPTHAQRLEKMFKDYDADAKTAMKKWRPDDYFEIALKRLKDRCEALVGEQSGIIEFLDHEAETYKTKATSLTDVMVALLKDKNNEAISHALMLALSRQGVDLNNILETCSVPKGQHLPEVAGRVLEHLPKS